MIHITTAMVIDGILVLMAIVAFLQWNKSEPSHDYKAEFSNQSGHLSIFNKGVAVTGNKAITKAQSCTNVALFGPTGSGKSSTVIISSVASLSRGKSSIIINDVSGEVYDRTSAYLAKKGYKILRLDFSNSLNSESFNPLLECRSISDIQKVALLVVRNAIGESKGDLFWEQSSIMLISLFIRYLVFHCTPEYRTMQNVLRLIEKFAVDTTQAVDAMFLATKDEELISSYKATLVIGEKTLQSVIISTRVCLNLWNDKEVCRTTATNTLDFSLLRKEPVALFVCNPLKDLVYFKPISALFFQSLFNYVLSRIPDKKERSIFFLLDEFAVYRFPNMNVVISNIRKMSAGLVICMQDEMALMSNYGQAEAHQIKTNCGCQIYLKGQPLHTCKELSQILGKYSYKEEEGGSTKNRELMTPDEIRMSEDAIILINNSAPLKCHPVPYYKNIWLKHLAKAKPLQLNSTNPIDPPLISFE